MKLAIGLLSVLLGVSSVIAQTVTVDFEQDRSGELPDRFSFALTGRGRPGIWVVMADETTPDRGNVLAQTDSDRTNYRFPVAVLNDVNARDLELSVRFKAISGTVDRAAGLVWRYQDEKNYYVVRANALENNVVLYKVEDGRRTDLPLKGAGRTYGKKADVPANTWSELTVHVAGSLVEVFLNRDKLFEAEDGTFAEAGKVGLWTKADSVTYFDDFSIIVRQ